MKTEYIFPIILMTLNFGASMVYFSKGNWQMGIYWNLALGLTAIVTFK